MNLSAELLRATKLLRRPHCLRILWLEDEFPAELAALRGQFAALHSLQDAETEAALYHLVVAVTDHPELIELKLRPGGLLLQKRGLGSKTDWELEDKTENFELRRRPSPTDAPIAWSELGEPDRELSIVMPFYNEQEGCLEVLEDLYQAFSDEDVDFEIVAVDNGSVDKTAEIFRELQKEKPRIRVVSVFPNRGYGWGILRGLAKTRGQAVAYMGGDGQVSAQDVSQLYRLYKAGDVDMAKVRRIKRGDGLVRAGISVIFNLLFSVSTGFLESDTNASPKIFNHSRLPKLKLSSKDWFLDAELMMHARKESWRVVELDVHFLPRSAGASYVRPGTLLEFLKNLVTARFRGTRRSERRPG